MLQVAPVSWLDRLVAHERFAEAPPLEERRLLTLEERVDA